MDARTVADIAIGVAALGVWFAVWGLCRLLTRPASPPPEPATPELGNEPPAIVSLVVNRWTVTEDAAESTLLDLAARRFIELRQPDNDPMHTTVHVPPAPPAPGTLRPYEQQVLDRIRGLAVDGVVPLSALTFRDDARAKAWNKQLRAQVIAEARQYGLSRRRFGPRVTSLLVFTAALAALGVGLAAFHYGVWTHADDNPGFGASIATFFVLSAIAGRSPGERDTPQGARVAARWLGVRDWLRAHEQFAELPPASVAVWDRYLGYGAAVGTTRLASAILDLGMGNRRLVWSSFGGGWHRVRVRYPRFWPRYGRTVPVLALRAAIFLALGVVILKQFGGPTAMDAEPDDRVGRVFDLVTNALFAIALALLLLGAYVLVRGLLDLATERTLTGEVLWEQLWRSTAERNNRPSRPRLHHLAVDDGSGDRTTAWALPSEWSARAGDGDVVTLRVRPWSRRVCELTVVGHGRSRRLVETVGPEDTGDLAAALLRGRITPS